MSVVSRTAQKEHCVAGLLVFLFSAVLNHDAASSSAKKSVSLSKVIHLPGVMFLVSNHGVCLSFYVKMAKLPNVDKRCTNKKTEQGGFNRLLFSMPEIKENIQVKKLYVEYKSRPEIGLVGSSTY